MITTKSISAFRVVYVVLLSQVVSRARLTALGTLAALLMFIGWAAGRSDHLSLQDAVRLIGSLGLAVLLPVGALIFATAALADLREDKTLVYLWLRPMPNWLVPTAAVAASATALLPIVVVAAAVTALLLGEGGSLVTASILAMIAGTFVYSAVFMVFGLYVKRTLLWGLVYILIWEGFIAGGGQGAARFAIRAYTRSIMAEITDVEISLANFSLTTSVIVCFGVAAAALVLAFRRYRSMDVD